MGVRQVTVPADVMKSLSPMETPQGTLFVCAMRQKALPEMLTGRRYVVLDTLQDPGNVGTILRTADAFHADGMFLVNGCADLYNPKTLRATMGAVFRCPVWMAAADELSAIKIPMSDHCESLNAAAAATVLLWEAARND